MLAPKIKQVNTRAGIPFGSVTNETVGLNPRSPGYGGARFSWRRATRPMPPRNADRSRRRVRRAISACPARLSHGKKPASSSRSASATSSIWRRRLFAFSATLEICRDDRIFHQERMPNRGRKRDSLISAETSLIARFNSLQGRKKFPVRFDKQTSSPAGRDRGDAAPSN